MTWWNFRNLLNLVKGSKKCKFNSYLRKAYHVSGLCTFRNINSLHPCNNEVDTFCDILQKETEAKRVPRQPKVTQVVSDGLGI